ncbi:hypothetical protein HZF05_06865 [Sphingomonas sp. CGMCC 1.13654]|uniref:STAS/SEC14 domain-containing protein n=1 Tax=Sphingomonas chungangi TaxID=2683589 RepID=A0A838L4I9_9SPHN|nr:STAS/SEC14 domain-containing protein [Sphingomonas chungangi]MBA2933820.1 hypothetical protein [Sphingomonas chungangi]MVW55150.1 hypothetical protein [Sphingomonas chungangi]
MGELTVGYDAAGGLVRTLCAGFLTIEDVRRWGAQLPVANAEARRAGKPVLHLVIALDSPVQSGDVIAEFATIDIHPVGPQDRMAVVVSSNLAKMQAARNFADGRERGFLDEAEAIAWLRG